MSQQKESNRIYSQCWSWASWHNDYPSAPEKLAIPCDKLSDYCQKIADKYGIKVSDVKKLIPN